MLMPHIHSYSAAKKGVVVYLEGLPGCGKTSTLEKLSTDYITLPEIFINGDVAEFHNLPIQTFFLKNDEQKLEKSEISEKTVIVDRSPLSTLFFNKAKHEVDPSHDSESIIEWFNNVIEPKISSSNCHFILIDIPANLSLKRKNREVNLNDPWANPSTLELIRKMFIERSKAYPSQFVVLDGRKEYAQILSDVREQISKYEQN